ncbi:MAG: type II secretion system GspH family protein [Heliobacteriaceae bacterium]|jgi:prepilin-type N-terminal cleavage/methylation domain-containing protein|nr:type II secretion system GspH family protein [Heliobacteriaceae bacterium]
MNRKAFTLAEVLITLGIIGIVAALTMPALISSTQKKELEACLKKQYSIMSQALQKMAYENGKEALSTDYPNANAFKSDFMKHFKVADECPQNNCVPYTFWKTYNGNNVGDIFGGPQFIAADGAIYFFFFGNPSQAVYIGVDVNGYKKPNKYGYDFFYFNLLVDNEKLIPGGASGSIRPEGFDCSKTSTGAYNGIYCTNEALTNPNYFKNLP